MTHFDFNIKELELLYNMILIYLTFEIVVNLPLVKTSLYFKSMYFCYLFWMMIFIVYLYFNDVFLEFNVKFNNQELYDEKKIKLHQIINFLTIMNMTDFVGVLMYYTYTYIFYEYYNTEQNNFEILTDIKNYNDIRKQNYTEDTDAEDTDTDDTDTDDTDTDDTDTDDTDIHDDVEDVEDVEDEEKEEDEEDDNEETEYKKTLKSSTKTNRSSSKKNINNNLSEECVDEIKSILSDCQSSRIILLIRVINKYLNK